MLFLLSKALPGFLKSPVMKEVAMRGERDGERRGRGCRKRVGRRIKAEVSVYVARDDTRKEVSLDSEK